MEIKIEKVQKIKPFEPFIAKIQFDTIEEVRVLFRVLNEVDSQEPEITPLNLLGHEIWEELNEQGFKLD